MDLIAIDTVDGPIFLPRVAAQALASGGEFDPVTECVVGGDPRHAGLPQNARQLTGEEEALVIDRVRRSLGRI